MQHAQDKFFYLIIAFLVCYLIYLLRPVLTPFLTAALLAYLANPLVNKLISFHIPRLLSITIVFLVFFATLVLLILLMIPLIERQINALVETIPAIFAWLQTSIVPWLKEHMGIQESGVNIDALKEMLLQYTAKAGGAVDWVLHKALESGFKLLEWITNIILIPVVTFYFLCDWDKVLNGLRSLLPRRIEPTVVSLLKECDTVLGAFFRGQFLVMIALALVYSVGLSIIGLQLGLLIGLIAGLLSIVPYLGFIVGIIAASIAAFVQFGSYTSVLLVWLVFVIAHVIDNVFLTPKLIGDRIGLHPIAVIFAILAGGSIFGFVGVLLALPVAASLMVWLRYLYQQYHKSKLYKA